MYTYPYLYCLKRIINAFFVPEFIIYITTINVNALYLEFDFIINRSKCTICSCIHINVISTIGFKKM
jgi:hypothetical protein